MASSADLLVDAFGRVQEAVHEVLDGLGEQELTTPPAPGANPVAWLIWHLARVQDDHVAGLIDAEQRWTADGWAERFGLPFATSEIGYGQSADEVAQVRGVTADLAGYLDAVHAATVDYVRGLDDAALDRVVDDNWDPPVTVAVRLISVINDDTQHVGQAAYARGVLEHRS